MQPLCSPPAEARPPSTLSFLRYTHAHNGVMNRKDFDQMVDLLVSVLQQLDEQKSKNSARFLAGAITLLHANRQGCRRTGRSTSQNQV